ncbi:hypothetical protein ACFV42_23335 [Streptomyces solisilvae]|uniref:hypothetical protein n=1 Tax=Streptomyces malaysiensis TaxID=92644 RepID=UPI00369A323A
MTDTEVPPATVEIIPGLPPVCCTEGRALLAAWVDSFAHTFGRQEPTFEAAEAEMEWTAHQVSVHRLNPPRVAGCSYCAEWEAHLKLGRDDSPNLDHPVGYEAARHVVRHQVFDALVKHHWNGKGPI